MESPRSIRYDDFDFHDEGGLGRIWNARDVLFERRVAFKVMKAEAAENPDHHHRFFREAVITGQLEHPNIVPVYDRGVRADDDEPFYVMKFVEGENLKDAIARLHRDGAAPAQAIDARERRRVLEALVGVCNAIAYAHSKGIIHRDLKPENIRLGQFGEVLVLDWGFAKRIRDDEADEAGQASPESIAGRSPLFASADGRSEGMFLGTLAYAAPEQAAARSEQISELTDIYGLGAILFEILYGRPPHQSPDPGSDLAALIISGMLPEIKPDDPPAPPRLEAIRAKAMARRPSDRYPRALDLADEIQSWLDDEPIANQRERIAALRAFADQETNPEKRMKHLEEIARLQTNIAMGLESMDRLAESESELREAADRWKELALFQPSVPRFRIEFASNRLKRKFMLQALGRFAEADDEHASVHQDLERLVMDFPREPGCRVLLIESLILAGTDPNAAAQRADAVIAAGLRRDRGPSGSAVWERLFEILVLKRKVMSTSRFLEACRSLSGRRDTPPTRLLAQTGWISGDAASQAEQDLLFGADYHEGPGESSTQFSDPQTLAPSYSPSSDLNLAQPSSVQEELFDLTPSSWLGSLSASLPSSEMGLVVAPPTAFYRAAPAWPAASHVISEEVGSKGENVNLNKPLNVDPQEVEESGILLAPGSGSLTKMPSPRYPDLLASQKQVSSAAAGQTTPHHFFFAAQNRFRVVRHLADGGASRIFLAEDQAMGRMAAIKVLKPKFAGDRSHHMLLWEARVCDALRHPGILPIYVLGTTSDDLPYFAMPYIQGQSLAQLALAAPYPQALRAKFKALIDACRILHYAHERGILHLDAKPHNILISKENRTYVIDWGLARPFDLERWRADIANPPYDQTTMPEGIAGTFGFISPEMVLSGGRSPLKPAADLFALGATLYYLLTGVMLGPRRRFKMREYRQWIAEWMTKGESPRALNPEIPLDLEAICLRAAAPHPEHRYETAAAMALDLEHWLRRH